ncbi:MAG: hypothetical protein QGG96_06345 [Candidatus Poseidoniaceae archaeon]|nr:hypothetical protein [Candidatus Poseidoniaceae archaeon]
MATMLLWSIAASVATAVADWAGWHFVWRHEFEAGEAVKKKRNAVSMFISYFLPFMPTLAIIFGPAKLGWYDIGFATASAKVLFVLMGILTGGVAASAWAQKRKHDEGKDARALIDQEDIVPEDAMQHLGWTTAMIATCSIFWFALLSV